MTDNIKLPWNMRLPLILTWACDTFATNAIRFLTLGGQHIVAATEANAQISMPFDFHIQRIQARVITNGKDAATVVSFRDDAAYAGPLLTVAAGVTGLQSSAILDTTIARDSLIALLIDASLSTVGNFQVSLGTVIGYILAQDIGPVAR